MLQICRRGHVNAALRLYFPKVAEFYEECAEYHKRVYDVQPLFGLFWNMCINSSFTGQRRVHCLPHVDFKNISMICALYVDDIKGFS